MAVAPAIPVLWAHEILEHRGIVEAGLPKVRIGENRGDWFIVSHGTTKLERHTGDLDRPSDRAR